MIIQGKSVRNVKKYLSNFNEGECFYIGLRNLKAYSNELIEYGIVGDLQEGESFLPRPNKKVTTYNSNGKVVINKSIKEERTIERQYSIVDWHGTPHSGTCYQTRMCYRRDRINPPEVELTYSNGLLLSPLLTNNDDSEGLTRHIINMYLEIFGTCEVLSEDLSNKKSTKLRRLSWNILPKGEYPWKSAKPYVDSILASTPNKYKGIISKRHEDIADKVPDFMAIGDQGFYGYIIYGFTSKNIYIFESNKPDNATYVFKGNWQVASRLTKSEILNGNLCETRIIHNKSWVNEVRKLVS